MKREIQDAKRIESIRSYLKHNEGSLEFLKKLKTKSMVTTHLYKKVNASIRKCNQYRNDLAFMELIAIEKQKTDTGVQKVLSITDTGKKVLKIFQTNKLAS